MTKTKIIEKSELDPWKLFLNAMRAPMTRDRYQTRAIIPKYVASNLRGTAYGLYNLIIGSTFFIGNVVFGYLWDIQGLNVAIWFSSIFVISGLLGMTFFIKRYA